MEGYLLKGKTYAARFSICLCLSYSISTGIVLFFCFASFSGASSDMARESGVRVLLGVHVLGVACVLDAIVNPKHGREMTRMLSRASCVSKL